MRLQNSKYFAYIYGVSSVRVGRKLHVIALKYILHRSMWFWEILPAALRIIHCHIAEAILHRATLIQCIIEPMPVD